MPNEFDFNIPDVDYTLYTQDVQSAPVITWQGRITSEDNRWGFWASSADDMPDAPPGWEAHEMRFGGNPNNPLTPIYFSHSARLVPIAWRRRWIVEDEAGYRHYYRWFEKRANRVEGKMTSQLQVLVKLAGDDALRMLALRGFTKGISWDNDPSTSRGSRDFPAGVMQTLQGYAKDATYNLREAGRNVQDLPWLCTFWADLQPWKERTGSGNSARWEPKLVQVGGQGGVWMSPYVASMEVGGDTGLDTRFVGRELFEHLQTTRREIGVAWEKEWDSFDEDAAVERSSEPYYNGDDLGGDPAGDMAEDIPF
jgi:hypothetical protein